MKTTIKTLFPALMLLAFSCKKESTAVQASGINDESSAQAGVTEINELGPNAVRIGTQVWMKKNLNVTHYRNGDRIPQVTERGRWPFFNRGAWCWYNNDSANGAVYGRLYNWYAVNDPRGLAPAGWHIPSNAEWETLTNFLGGFRVAGHQMKSTGTIEDGTGLWYAPNFRATNRSGFTGLPGGWRSGDGYFYSIGYFGNWWSSKDHFGASAWSRGLSYDNGSIGRSSGDQRNGFSVRCLRD